MEFVEFDCFIVVKKIIPNNPTSIKERDWRLFESLLYRILINRNPFYPFE